MMLVPADPSQPWFGALIANALSVTKLAEAGDNHAISDAGVRWLTLKHDILAAEFGPPGSRSALLTTLIRGRR